ncbi:MAG: alpha/beta hydrolase [Pseudomonadales bacterium]|nr:alpha/beta hydrolase [Pseudomonadales bacterium]
MFDLSIQDRFIEAGGHRLKTRTLGKIDPSKPTLVFMHEGLGSIGLWKDFPEQVAQAVEMPVLMYDRWGHGDSDQLIGARKPSYRHVESLEVMPEVLRQFELGEIILIGHSDGGCMSLLYASQHPTNVLGIVGLAPQVGTPAKPPQEELPKTAGSTMQLVMDHFENGGLKQKLARYHGDNTETMFYGWANAWGSKEFAGWNMRAELKDLKCPVQVIVGDKDPYGYQHNIDELKNESTTSISVSIEPNAGHVPHLEAREFTLQHTVAAINSWVLTK